MYGFELKEKILATNDYSTFAKIVRDFMKDAAYSWLDALEEKERNALVMLEFDPAIATTMMFFRKDIHLFSDRYMDVLEAILTKAEQMADRDKHNMLGIGNMQEIAWNAMRQFEEEKKTRDYAAKIAAELNMKTGIHDLENVLVRNSGNVRYYRHAKYASSRDLRKLFLHDILDYLRANYNGGPCNEEEEDE